MDIQALLSTPKTPREIPDSQDVPTRPSQATTESWDSQNGPRSVSPSPFQAPTTPTTPSQSQGSKTYAPALTRSDRIRIKTALDSTSLRHRSKRNTGSHYGKYKGHSIRESPHSIKRREESHYSLHLLVIS
jgi:hypothetical protein